MTYQEIQETYHRQYGSTIKSCWISDVKRRIGLPVRNSPNRINQNSVKYPCPDQLRFDRIKKILLTK